jgi:hypothetical protein
MEHFDIKARIYQQSTGQQTDVTTVLVLGAPPEGDITLTAYTTGGNRVVITLTRDDLMAMLAKTHANADARAAHAARRVCTVEAQRDRLAQKLAATEKP